MNNHVRETVEDLEKGDAVTLVVGDEDQPESYQCVVDGRTSAGDVYLRVTDHEAFREVELRFVDDAYRGVVADFKRVDELGPEPVEDVLDVTLR